MSLKIAVKQFCTDVRNRSTLDHSLRTGRSIEKLNAMASRCPQLEQLVLGEHAQGVEAQLLPLERLVVDEDQLDRARARLLDQLDDRRDRRRVEVLELFKVQLERHAFGRDIG